MTRRLRHIVYLRLMLALGLLALSGDLAVPALAATLRAGFSVAMPCHSTSAEPAADVHADAAPHASAAQGPGAHADPPQSPGSGTTELPQHLCCVLAGLVLAPGSERADPVPAPRLSAWDEQALPAPSGRALPVPRPPPRPLS